MRAPRLPAGPCRKSRPHPLFVSPQPANFAGIGDTNRRGGSLRSADGDDLGDDVGFDGDVDTRLGEVGGARQIDAEFKAYKARFQVTRMFVQENQAAIVMTWDAVDRKSGEQTRIDMVGLFELGPSGQFSSAVLYFDSAKAKALANLVQ